MVMQYSLLMFEESLQSKASVKIYKYLLGKFIEFYKLRDHDSIITIENKDLQRMVETYVIHLKRTIGPNSVSTYTNPIKTFLEVNDIDLNWRKIRRLFPAMMKRSGSSAYQTSDVKRMLDATPQIRNKAVIHFIASSGVRIGALCDLKLKHIQDMPLGCKMITIYEDSTEEYQTFLTPEAAKALDLYLEQRRQDNELLNDESPLFRERYQLGGVKLRAITTRALQSILIRARVNSAVSGKKKNGRYSEQLAHGFRKRFNTILKLNNEVNDNAVEKMMGHKHGLDGVYFQGTNEQLFEEFRKGISDLTVDDSERTHAENMKLKEEKSELLTSINHSLAFDLISCRSFSIVDSETFSFTAISWFG